MELLGGEVQLRSKRELIEKFIEENLTQIAAADNIQDEFEKDWQDQKVLALARICDEENLYREKFNALMEAYIFSSLEPIRDEVLRCLDNPPSDLSACEIGNRILQNMKAFVEVFGVGMAA